MRLAVADQPVISIPRGTRLEVVSLGEHWDNRHATIARWCQISADLRLITGPNSGQVIHIVIGGDAVPIAGGGESESYHLPDWLAPGTHA